MLKLRGGLRPLRQKRSGQLVCYYENDISGRFPHRYYMVIVTLLNEPFGDILRCLLFALKNNF